MKRYLGLLLVALMMFSVLFVSVSCSGPNDSVPAPDPAYNDPNNPEHNGIPILPKGSVALRNNVDSIPMDWSTNSRGMKNLPAVTYSFAGDVDTTTNVTKELKDAIKAAQDDPKFFDDTPKKVLFLFSDGWGVTEVKMSREYKGELILDSLPYSSESMTDSYLKYKFDGAVDNDYSSKTTTDSCAGGTQVLAGFKTRYGHISLDVDGKEIPNLAEAAKGKGWKVACVTNDNIVDATPADCIIHDTNRYHTDVLYYKALMADDWDLLMGWGWFDTYFGKSTWADRLLSAEKSGIADAIERAATSDFNKLGLPAYDGGDPITYFKSLSTMEKAFAAGFSVYYTIWEKETGKHNSFRTWTTTGSADLAAYLNWLDSATGLAKAISDLDTKYGNPNDRVSKFGKFKDVLANNDFSKPVLATWTAEGNKYNASKPNRGYLLNGSVGKAAPSWPEMVAYTIYQMDSMAGADGNFFALLENTCTDGWGHSDNYDTKTIAMLNEVQCFDEGVAIAVKYVLEHPDTLLVISADHETGNFALRTGWEKDINKIKSQGEDHSSQNVPLYAFGAGAKNFSPEEILNRYGNDAKAHVSEGGKVHEGWITGQLMGELITGSSFGQQVDYKGN